MTSKKEDNLNKQLNVDVCFTYNNYGVIIEKRIGTVWHFDKRLICLHDKNEVEEAIEIIQDQLQLLVDNISIKEVLKEIKERSR